MQCLWTWLTSSASKLSIVNCLCHEEWLLPREWASRRGSLRQAPLGWSPQTDPSWSCWNNDLIVIVIVLLLLLLLFLLLSSILLLLRQALSVWSFQTNSSHWKWIVVTVVTSGWVKSRNRSASWWRKELLSELKMTGETPEVLFTPRNFSPKF